MKKIDEESLVEVDGKLFKIGIIEYDDTWFPLKSELSKELADEEDYDEEDDEDGISDTMILDDELDVEEGEILESENDDEVVEETVLSNNNTSGEQSPVAEPANMHGGNHNSHGDGESQYGELQQSLGENTTLKSPIKVHSVPIPDNLNCSNDGPGFGKKFEHLKGCFGPFTFTAGAGHSGSLSSHNLEFCGSFIKRRRLRMGSGSFNTQVVDLSNVEKFPLQPPPINLQSPIDLNNSPTASHSDPPQDTSDVLPLIPEIERTAEIGRLVGFDIAKDNVILKEFMGEAGDQITSP
ncbi:hypothetical protein L2E82_27949 [Cichorium intybus]|uniref:Uncharacterized protein n=1 Tax=Cichorium intybus TaxID=13427 RepID=A0ACB9CUF6_CICIN|nr:hypothetical protein L2E82_27949 [Cichorium intybus]